MAISTNQLAVRYAGTGVPGYTYSIPFPFLSPDHILVAVSLNGIAPPTVLGAGTYEVLAQPPRVVVHAAVPVEGAVTIFRQVPLTQPTVFQPHGPFPAKANEQALDRLTMQVQQINRAVNELRGIEAGPEIVDVPASGSLHEVEVWTNDTERSARRPRWAGQLGVNTTDRSLWVGQSVALGDWTPYLAPSQPTEYTTWLLAQEETVLYDMAFNFLIVPTGWRLTAVRLCSFSLDDSTHVSWRLTNADESIEYATGTVYAPHQYTTTRLDDPRVDVNAGELLRIIIECDGNEYDLLGGRKGLQLTLQYIPS